jgi:hypothetical protein
VRALIVLLGLVACDKSSSHQSPPASKPAAAPIVADAGVVAIVDAAPAVDAAPIACEVAALKAARKQADAYVKAGQYDAAIALLQPDGCYLEDEQSQALHEQIAWRISDLAYAYYKAGKLEDCYAVAASQLAPYRGNVDSFDNLEKPSAALAYNAKLCQEAVDKKLGAFTDAAKCTLAEDAWGIPAEALGGDDREACIVQSGDRKDEEGLRTCGEVTLVQQSKKGRLSRTKLKVDDGNLTDGSVCCNITSVGFARRPKTWAMRVVTLGRNCDGGTASTEEQQVYELEGTALRSVHTMGAAFH